MRCPTLIVALAVVSSLVASTSAPASTDELDSRGDRPESALSSDPQDPSNLLTREIPERRAQRGSLFPVAPLKGLHEAVDAAEDALYRATHLKLGLTLNQLFQWVSDVLPGKDNWGTTTDADLVGSWELINRGKPTQGELYAHLEGRWDYGTTGPQDLGFDSLASAGGTANAFSKYVPAFIIRNLYWEQGSRQAGWAFRIGKITTDAMMGTSRHISPMTTFLPNVGTGFFSAAYPDSGLGAAAVWYPSDRFRILGLVSDANGDRTDLGDIGAGDLYKTLELGVKIAPKTENAGFSKFAIWHNDGTKNGQPSNANTGAEGWGMTVKIEQELTDDGRMIGILRWGKSWDDSSIFKQQAGAHLLFYDPPGPAGLQHDVVGVAANWVDSVVAGSRNEYNVEIFYRLPIFPGVDARLSYQSVINPALTEEIGYASVLSLGLRTVF